MIDTFGSNLAAVLIVIQVILFPMLTASTTAACFPFASAFSAFSAVDQIEGWHRRRPLFISRYM